MALRFRFLLLALFAPAMLLAGQTAPGSSDVQAPRPAAAVHSTLPSATLQSPLDVLKRSMTLVRVEKWKGSNSVRNEAETNLASIERDLESTLPPLLAAADAAPDSVARALPVYRNVEALYDVLLRVVTAGRLTAPGDQVAALEQALARLDEGRRALGDSLQQDAETQEKRVADLRAALKAVPPPPPPPAPVPVATPATPARKKKPRPTAKPASPPPASQSSATSSH